MGRLQRCLVLWSILLSLLNSYGSFIFTSCHRAFVHAIAGFFSCISSHIPHHPHLPASTLKIINADLSDQVNFLLIWTFKGPWASPLGTYTSVLLPGCKHQKGTSYSILFIQHCTFSAEHKRWFTQEVFDEYLWNEWVNECMSRWN